MWCRKNWGSLCRRGGEGDCERGGNLVRLENEREISEVGVSGGWVVGNSGGSLVVFC